jgi:Tfp pilus assembly protein PilZ
MNKIKDKQVLKSNIMNCMRVGAMFILFNIVFSKSSSLSSTWKICVNDRSMNSVTEYCYVGRINNP